VTSALVCHRNLPHIPVPHPKKWQFSVKNLSKGKKEKHSFFLHWEQYQSNFIEEWVNTDSVVGNTSHW
jgi:hypothetical protein